MQATHRPKTCRWRWHGTRRQKRSTQDYLIDFRSLSELLLLLFDSCWRVILRHQYRKICSLYLSVSVCVCLLCIIITVCWCGGTNQILDRITIFPSILCGLDCCRSASLSLSGVCLAHDSITTSRNSTVHNSVFDISQSRPVDISCPCIWIIKRFFLSLGVRYSNSNSNTQNWPYWNG